MRRGDFNSPAHVLDRSGKDDADWGDLVDARVGAVEPARHVVETYFAGNTTSQLCFEVICQCRCCGHTGAQRFDPVDGEIQFAPRL